jgi:EAL domain-containing protein (putative c-di-GMP-specific phosphodiesterase class I)/GGDEF domain-containing protein
MGLQTHKDILIYVVDENFQLLYCNEVLRAAVPEEERGRFCREVLCGKNAEKGPGKFTPDEGRFGQSIAYSSCLNSWIRSVLSPIEWPGHGICCHVMSGAIENGMPFDEGMSSIDYNELIEINYLEDKYDVVYHVKENIPGQNTSGCLSKMVAAVAEKTLHPDDRERFLKFWATDHVGKPGVPDTMKASKQSSFRRVNADGSYKWVQNMFMPGKQSSENSIFVMSFLKDADKAYGNSGTSDGLLNRESFYSAAAEMLGRFTFGIDMYIAAIDIEGLKIFNDWYGREKGTQMLSDISLYLKSLTAADPHTLAGYFGADDFTLLAPKEEFPPEKVYREIEGIIRSYCSELKVLPMVGVYEIKNKTDRVHGMYDRAKLAANAVQGNYLHRVKKFDNAMFEAYESEYVLFSDVQKAFQNSEFIFYLQPKCDMATGKIIGAEALARWVHPGKGLVSPGVFIPFLEKSGLISKLDVFIWEKVCIWQKSRIDGGKPLFPVSVNVSKADLYFVDVPKFFDKLIKKHGLSADLLEIEITESAYAENNEFVSAVVKELQRLGFHVLMDDFGAAYSSLNMLQSISFDMIKTDTRFLTPDELENGKDQPVLRSICDIARIMDIGVITEGVETEQQKLALLDIGYKCGQGFYFYRPMPVAEFEDLAETPGLVDQERNIVQKAKVETNDILDIRCFTDGMKDNLIGAVAIYDVYNDQIHMTQCSKRYVELLGQQHANDIRILGAEVYPEQSQKILAMFKRAKQSLYHGASCEIARVLEDGTNMWLHIKAFFLGENSGHDKFYCSLNDMTETFKHNEIVEFLNSGMPGGYHRHICDPNLAFTFISQGFLDITGFSKAEIREKFGNSLMGMIHPDDRGSVRDGIRNMEGQNLRMEYRLNTKHGYVPVTDYSHIIRYGGRKIFQGIVLEK